MTIYTRNNTPQGFYVYMYLREDGTPYYVGKGTKKRAWESHKRRNNTEVLPPDHARIHIVEHSLKEDQAHDLERKLIAYYGRKDLGTGILRNLTDGGDGTSGGKFGPMSAESNAKRSKAMAGRVFSEEHKAKLRAVKAGRKLSDEHKKNIAKKMLGRKQTPEHIQNNILSRTKGR